MRPQGIDGNVADVVAVDLDGAGIHIVETRNQIRDGRLSGAGRSDESDHLPGGGGKRDMGKRGNIFRVGEADVLDADGAFGGRQHDGVRFVGDRFVHVEHAEDALRPRQRLLDARVGAGKAFQRIRHIDRVSQERDESTRRDAPVHDLLAAEPDQGGGRRSRDEFDGRRQHAGQPHVLH